MSTKLIVATFNLRREFVLDKNITKWKLRYKTVADIIKKSNASIIGVQELSPDMKHDLKKQLTGYSFIGIPRSNKFFNEHSDIIIKDSTIMLDSYETFWLSKNPNTPGSRVFTALFPRICTAAVLNIKNVNQKIRVYNTHFDNVSQLARKVSVDVILNNIKHSNEIQQLPLILTGDFNAKPYSKEITKLLHNEIVHLHSTYSGGEGTYHGMIHKGKISHRQYDYIFISDEFELKDVYIDKTFTKGVYPSDHYPIISTLKI